jgi:DNA-binding NarL/FixJ family response regulator
MSATERSLVDQSPDPDSGWGEPARPASEPLKVLIADDHPLLLHGVRRVLESQSDIEVVGQAQNGPELVALIERRNPGLVLMDLRMPGADGFDLIVKLRTDWPDVKLVVLSASDDRASVNGALAAGASAFVVKSTAATDIASVLRQVSGGAIFHAPSVALAGMSMGDNRGSQEPAEPVLTEREQEILAAVANGRTTAVISRELWVSEHTVKFHLTNIYRKLGVANRSGAVRYAFEHGLVA